MPVFFIMAAAIGAIAGIIAILGTEAGRWMLMAFILIPLYTRLKPEQVVNHFVRGQILGYVKANPGETYTHIRKALNISNGQFVYHSRILESQDFIKSVKDGANRRFYPAGMRIPREVKDVELNQVQRIIYTIILEYPGISQSRIAKMMELAPSTVNYHVNIMTKVGVVERKRSGRLSLCFAAQELD
jgi:predicted transcriptional regulator